jgi:hypothetical protein
VGWRCLLSEGSPLHRHAAALAGVLRAGQHATWGAAAITRWCCKRATPLSAPEESPVLAMRGIPFTGVLLVLGCYLSGIVDAQQDPDSLTYMLDSSYCQTKIAPKVKLGKQGKTALDTLRPIVITRPAKMSPTGPVPAQTLRNGGTYRPGETLQISLPRTAHMIQIGMYDPKTYHIHLVFEAESADQTIQQYGDGTGVTINHTKHVFFPSARAPGRLVQYKCNGRRHAYPPPAGMLSQESGINVTMPSPATPPTKMTPACLGDVTFRAMFVYDSSKDAVSVAQPFTLHMNEDDLHSCNGPVKKGAICGTAKSPNAHPLPKGMDWASLQLNPMDDCQCDPEYFSKKGKGHDCVATEKCADFRLAVGFAEYELHAPTTTSNRICAKVSAQCTAGTVQIANPTATTDRKCQAPGPPPPPPPPLTPPPPPPPPPPPTPTPSNSLPKVRAT